MHGRLLAEIPGTVVCPMQVEGDERMAEGMAYWTLAWRGTELELCFHSRHCPGDSSGTSMPFSGPHLARLFAWKEDHIAGNCQTSGSIIDFMRLFSVEDTLLSAAHANCR